jgi:hypothetical protein
MNRLLPKLTFAFIRKSFGATTGGKFYFRKHTRHQSHHSVWLAGLIKNPTPTHTGREGERNTLVWPRGAAGGLIVVCTNRIVIILYSSILAFYRKQSHLSQALLIGTYTVGTTC